MIRRERQPEAHVRIRTASSGVSGDSGAGDRSPHEALARRHGPSRQRTTPRRDGGERDAASPQPLNDAAGSAGLARQEAVSGVLCFALTVAPLMSVVLMAITL